MSTSRMSPGATPWQSVLLQPHDSLSLWRTIALHFHPTLDPANLCNNPSRNPIDPWRTCAHQVRVHVYVRLHTPTIPSFSIKNQLALAKLITATSTIWASEQATCIRSGACTNPIYTILLVQDPSLSRLLPALTLSLLWSPFSPS